MSIKFLLIREVPAIPLSVTELPETNGSSFTLKYVYSRISTSSG